MLKNIVIYGAGGFGREVAWLIERINKVNPEWNVLGFIDDVKTEMYGKTINNLPVLGGNDWLDGYKNEVYVTCAIGNSKVRRKVYDNLEKYDKVKLATLIDPSVCVADTAQIGAGSILCYACSIMVNVKIGKGVVVNIGTRIGHDSMLSDYCTCYVNTIVSGYAKIGEDSEIGSGAFILQCKVVGNDIIVAPLSAVLTDISEAGTYAGNPARRMR